MSSTTTGCYGGLAASEQQTMLLLTLRNGRFTELAQVAASGGQP